MEILDIVILFATFISMIVGWFRGFVRESISISTLFFAIWGSMRFGSEAGRWFDNTINSIDLQVWAGRLLVFLIVLALGVIIGWVMSKLVRLSGLSIVDRMLGSVFGIARSALFLGVFVLIGQYVGFATERWWLEANIIPYGEYVADWIVEMAPKGMELLQQNENIDITNDLGNEL
tara:strand:+ start:50 stop:577 length:528 start_codon:yes stop_codon:yes gene_type:complete